MREDCTTVAQTYYLPGKGPRLAQEQITCVNSSRAILTSSTLGIAYTRASVCLACPCPYVGPAPHAQHAMRPSSPLLKTSGSSARWLARQGNDPFVRARAGAGAADGYLGQQARSRASFKLQALARRHPGILPRGGAVVDLGAAPGGSGCVGRLCSARRELMPSGGVDAQAAGPRSHGRQSARAGGSSRSISSP